jgi:glycerol-3-phosphate acyltransferase PlsY
MLAALLTVAAYLCGSLPTGLWLGRRAGVDVRRSGSGNIGATNVARTAGLRLAILTLSGDVAKGFVPAMAAGALIPDQRLVALVGLAAFFGHLFSVFARFSGGKGVATAFGVFLALAPAAAGLAALLFAAVASVTRYASVASIVAAASLPLLCVALGGAAPVNFAAVCVATAIVIRHRENLSRLARGTEPTFQVRR